jgi:hypothetical protein
VIVEALDKPAVVVVTAEFITIGERIASLKGHADLRQLVLPYPLEGLPDEEVHQIALDAYPRLLERLGAAR